MAKETTTKKRATKTTKKPARKAVSARATKKPATKKTASKKPAIKSADVTGGRRVSLLSLRTRRSRTIGADVIDADSLRRWNKWLAVLYALQGIAIAVLSKSVFVAITALFLAKDSLLSKADGSTVLSPASQHLFDVNPAYILAGTLGILAVLHAAAALWYRDRYETGLQTKVSGFRWLASTFALSGALGVVALICGVRDIVSLAIIVTLVVLGSTAGYALELLNRNKQQLSTLVYRVYAILFFAAWAIIAAYLLFGGIYDGNIPTYVYYLFVSTVLLSFVLTSIVRLFNAGKGNWANYHYGERAFLVTTFVLVSVIAWQVYAGLLA
jgi:hypothetical protein